MPKRRGGTKRPFGIRHSAFGYLQRSHILKRCLPISVGGDSRVAPVHVDALAEGICLATEHAQAGDDYVFSGESQRFSELFREFARQPGGMKVRVFMPRWFMRPQMVLFEALLRRAGLSAFLSRDLVDQSRGDYDYSSSKAQEELGWSCPPAAEMWDQIFADEQQLLAQQDGLRNKLRPVSVVPS
jgi:nucleoside-diphosphate-sugar epimerase